MTVGDPGPTSVMLSWEALPYVTHYEVSFQRSPAEGSHDRQTQCGSVTHVGTIGVGTATEYTLDDLEEDSIYTITVTAVYTGGNDSSKEVITTQQAGNISSHEAVYSTVTHHSSSFSSKCSSSECQSRKHHLNYYHCGMEWC